MKQVIIPIGSPGEFRTGWGQFPDMDAIIIAHFVDPDGFHGETKVTGTMRGWEMEHYPVYAWSYAPTPPIVDDFEAFKAMWEADADDFPYFYAEPAALLYINGQAATPTCFTLESAQRISYDHFLSTLNS